MSFLYHALPSHHRHHQTTSNHRALSRKTCAIYSVCLALPVVFFSVYIFLSSLSITHHTPYHTAERPSAQTIFNALRIDPLHNFFVFFLTVRYSSCFSFGTASAAADDDGDGGGGGAAAAVVVVIFLFYIFFAIFFHSPSTSLIPHSVFQLYAT